MNISFVKDGWEDYLYWQTEDKKILQKINNLIKEITRNPFEGAGKPEALKHDLSGFWSRRITDEHRLVYKIYDNEVLIINCRFHY